MKLSTNINIEKSLFNIATDSIICGIGSCFSEYVMKQFSELGLDVSSNPNGIVYNTYSIFNSLSHITGGIKYSENDFIFYNNLWHSWDHHGSFSDSDKRTFQNKIEEASELFLKKLKQADCFIITPSSSVVYCLKNNDRIVANCHKYPGNAFYTKILAPDENYKFLSESIRLVRSINKNINIVITLSPVRHYPGNLQLNSLSKANLIYAIHKCIEQYEGLYYFASYEILLDELRDYRFFAEDMLHPSDLARKIIFEKFLDATMDSKTISELKKREKIIKRNKHRTINILKINN